MKGIRTARTRKSDESGFTVVEYVVAMGIFSILLGIFTTGITSMTHSTIRVQNTGDNATEALRAFTTLDKQVRYASAINREVVTADSRWFLEYRTDATPSGLPQCTQWRYQPTNKTLAVRTWRAGAAGTVSGWRVVASRVVPKVSGSAPLVMKSADATYAKQRLEINLSVVRRGSPPSDVNAVLVARNTDSNTATNSIMGNTGTSAAQVCQDVTRS